MWDLVSSIYYKVSNWIDGLFGDWMPGWMAGIAFELLLSFLFIATVYLISRFREKKFWRLVEEREEQLADIRISTGPELADGGECSFVSASIVVGQGHYRRFTAGLRKLIGGEVRSFGDLHERGRREAVNRLKEEARLRGADRITGVRFQSSGLAPLDSPSMILAVEITAYGTAITK